MTWATKLMSKSTVSAKEVDYTVHAALAEELYTAAAPIAPKWDQLGGGTQLLWMYRASLKAAGVEDWWSIKHEKRG